MDGKLAWQAILAAVVVVGATVGISWLVFGDDFSDVELGDGVVLPSAAIEQLQRDLVELSYYAGPIDGVYSQLTTEAVRNFQEAAGLEADGIVGSATNNALALALGRPTSMKFVQGAFSGLCYFGGEIDGAVSPRLSGAIARYQADNGLDVDAKYGPDTANAMVASYADRPGNCSYPEDTNTVDVLFGGAYVGFDVEAACALDGDDLASVFARTDDGGTFEVSTAGRGTLVVIRTEGVEITDPESRVERNVEGGFELVSGGVQAYVPSTICVE